MSAPDIASTNDPTRSAVSVNATAGQLDEMGMGECNREYNTDWRHFDRNPFEHPEQAFRRGLQHGAHRVYVALEKAGVLDAEVLKQIKAYYGLTLWEWRYARRRRLGRRLNVDDPPWLEIKPARRRVG